MGQFFQDLRYGLRILTKYPGFAAVAVLSIALGIGVNTTVYSWIEVFLLRPMPGVADGDRIAVLENLAPSGELLTSSYPDYRDYRAQVPSLAGLSAFQDQPLVLGEGREARRIWAERVSADFFDVLGVHPQAGRFFRPEEGAAGGPPVAVLGDGLWHRRFGADPGIVGRTIVLDRHPLTVVGIAPPSFLGATVGLAYDLWVPLPLERQWNGGRDRLAQRSDRSLHLLGRLRAGTPLAAAQAEVRGVAQRLARAYPDTNQGIGATLRPVRQASYGAQSLLGPLLAVLAGIASLVLLMVCANVANLLLARATARRRELGIRAALGGGRGRLVRQLLTESLSLSLLGGIVGLLAAFWMTDALSALLPPTHLPVAAMPGPDGRVLAASLLLSLVAGLLFGTVPAFQAATPGLPLALGEGGRGASPGRRPRALRNLLVVAEVALATLVLVGAGLFLRAFERARAIRPGFAPEHVLLVGVTDPGPAGYGREAAQGFYQRLAEQLAALPGVSGIAMAEKVPLGFEGGSWEEAGIEGYVPPPTENMKIFRNLVSPGYFSVLRIPLLAGRDFGPRDDLGGAPVIVVNDTFARRYLPGVSPLGRHVRVWGRTATIVGVVATAKYGRLAEAPQPYLYAPLFQHLDAGMGVVFHLRTAGDPEGLLPGVRRTFGSDPALVGFTAPMSEYVGAALFPERTGVAVLGCLGALALVLAALGLYGVVSYSVTERTHEIGIRMALGASREDVVLEVLGQGMRLVAAGLAFGTLASLALARALPGISGNTGRAGSAADWSIFAAVAVLLSGVALAANYLPARRATEVDPVAAIQRG
jgi:predicted permease